MKQGVYDVIPLGSLANMTAEDLRLLLCGTQEVFFASRAVNLFLILD